MWYKILEQIRKDDEAVDRELERVDCLVVYRALKVFLLEVV